MAKSAWYARTTWSPTDREEFLTRLRAVVGAHEQAACLRKQAAHLLKARTPEALGGARELYELLLAQFPDSSDLAYVHTALGELGMPITNKQLTAVEAITARLFQDLETLA